MQLSREIASLPTMKSLFLLFGFLLLLTLGAAGDNIQSIEKWLALPVAEREQSIPEMSLSREEATKFASMIWEVVKNEARQSRKPEIDGKFVNAAGKEMLYLEKVFGDAPEGERSLWISMHGGGGAPARVNDGQWRNQIRLYAPKEGFIVAPRAPTNTWNLWHQGHIDDLFDRLIANYVVTKGVAPNRIYLMGYSAGGDGVYQLAPRMADRFAAAAMMAGHPNDAQPLGLRNLPFMIFMGGNDSAYKRNQVAAEWGKKLMKLKNADSGKNAYLHKVTIYEGLGHWMNGKDRQALPWMAKHTRNPWPKKIVWHQSSRTHDRFYWLAVPKGSAKKGQTITATVSGQKVEISLNKSDDNLKQLKLRLSDQLLALDQEIEVFVNGTRKYNGLVTREPKAIWESLKERLDPDSISTATLAVQID